MSPAGRSGGEALDQALRAVGDPPPPAPAAAPTPAPASADPAAPPLWPLFAGLAAVVVVLDQATKALVVGALGPGESTAVLGDWLRIVHGRNSGAIFGLFRDNATLFGIVSLAVVALIVGYHARAGRSALVSIALGLLLGGAIGNVIDRFRLGYVVDFVDAGVGGWRFYTFNVADSAISTALVLLVALSLVPDPGARLARLVRPRPASGAPRDGDGG